MAKKGMKRPTPENMKSEKTTNSEINNVKPVPEIQGKAQKGKAKADLE